MVREYEQVYRQNEYETNEKVSLATRLIFCFILATGVLCWIGVFNVETYIMNRLILATLIPLLLPSLIVDIIHMGEPWVKYVLLTCVSIVMGISYVIFTFQAVLIFVIPTILAALYFNKKVLNFTIIQTIFTIVISHLVTCFYLLQPWVEPFTNPKDIMLYGASLRVLQYLCIAIIIYMLSNRSAKFIDGFYTLVKDKEQLVLKLSKQNDTFVKIELEEELKLLTEREIEVCRLLSLGYTNAQIANELYLSVGTIKNYVSNIYDKTGIKDRTALALKLFNYFKECDQGHMR